MNQHDNVKFHRAIQHNIKSISTKINLFTKLIYTPSSSYNLRIVFKKKIVHNVENSFKEKK